MQPPSFSTFASWPEPSKCGREQNQPVLVDAHRFSIPDDFETLR